MSRNSDGIYEGKTCGRGHTRRYLSNGKCVDCMYMAVERAKARGVRFNKNENARCAPRGDAAGLRAFASLPLIVFVYDPLAVTEK